MLLALALMMAASSKDAQFFEKRVAPILKRRCSGCHNAELKDGGISVFDRASLLKGGLRADGLVSLALKLVKPGRIGGLLDLEGSCSRFPGRSLVRLVNSGPHRGERGRGDQSFL